MPVAQILLAVTIAMAMAGTYFALTPPHDPSSSPPPSSSQAAESQTDIPFSGDTIRRIMLTNKHTAKVTMLPLAFAAIYTSLLAVLCEHPGVEGVADLPTWLLRHGTENGLNRQLITWSPHTVIPLAVILTVGVPLRLISYTSLGTNFTFDLTRPDALSTTGIYRHVQHPSYTGLIAILAGHAALFARPDGVVACCLVSPDWYPIVRALAMFVAAPVMAATVASGVWTRVRQEERMLRGYFGREWEVWHSSTPRFLPSIARSPMGNRIKES